MLHIFAFKLPFLRLNDGKVKYFGCFADFFFLNQNIENNMSINDEKSAYK